MDLIQHNQEDKVSKMLERGFDPNYHDSDTGGEAPNTLSHNEHRCTVNCKPVCKLHSCSSIDFKMCFCFSSRGSLEPQS